MSNIITFTSIKAMKGITNANIKPDSEGYYRIVLGALNMHNVHGEYYELADRVKDLFSPNGAFTTKLREGKVYSELGHPKPKPTDNLKSFMQRIKRIEETNVCAHIKSVELVDTGKADGNSTENIILIYGLVKPFGPHAQVLRDSLTTGDINTAFSIRSITNDRFVNGKKIKTIKEIVNFDMVLSNGIPSATKWKTIGIESTEMLSLDLEDELVQADITNIIEMEGVSMEDISKMCSVMGCLVEMGKENNDNINEKSIIHKW